ncbi:aldehyde dehydrogenase family protein [Paraburkholderia sediminicola]
MARVRSYIDAAHDEGARLLSPEGKIDGCFMAPMVFGDVTPTMKIAKEEIFGPVLSVLTFKTFDEALRIANDTSYGLAATVWTKDMTRAHAAVRALRAGKLAVRSRPGGGEQTGFALSTEPWGSSGFGVEGGMNGLRSYCRLKAVEFVCG